MKKFSFDIHYDMVIRDVEIIAETLEEARQMAYGQAARLPLESMECVGKDACLEDDPQELTAGEIRKMENEKIQEFVRSWFASYYDPSEKQQKRTLYKVVFGKDFPYWLSDISKDAPQWERDMKRQLCEGIHPRQAVIERYTRLYGMHEIKRLYGYRNTAKSLYEANGLNTASREQRKQAIVSGCEVLCDKMDEYVMNQDEPDFKGWEPQMTIRYDFGTDKHGYDDYWNLFVYCHGPNDCEDASDCYELATAWQHQHYDRDGRDLCDDYGTEMHDSRAALIGYLFYANPPQFEDTDQEPTEKQMTDVWVD